MTAAPRRPRPHPRPPEEPRSFLMTLWEQADQLVPFPFLYFWVARPHGAQPAATLHHLTHVDFVYNLATNFIAFLSCRDGVFSAPVIARESLGYRLMPVQNRQGLLSPEAAERAIDIYLRTRELEFWELFFLETGLGAKEIITTEENLLIDLFYRRYLELPWHSLRFERPLRAGEVEPVYKFRKARSRCEFIVGTVTGRVRHEHVIEQVPPAPPLCPPDA